ncbi:MAG: ribosomal protein L11 methyltransferase [Kiritimatiellia bacterium]|jgi:ribosomal protein L11 methyltransferase
MPVEDLHVLTLEIAREKLDEVTAWVMDATDTSPVELDKLSRDKIWLEIYFQDEIEARLIGCSAVEAFACPVAVRSIAQQDWTTFWHHHFKPHVIGQHLWIRPEWSEDVSPDPERHTILVNPGLSFGTGEHFTTRFCLEALDTLMDQAPVPNRLFDAGCGSAIIAIAAAKFGCPEILAVDHDQLALESAAENLELNDVKGVTLQQMDLTQEWPSGRFDWVFANLFGSLLVELSTQLADTCNDYLVITGIREIEAEMVAEAFARTGLTEVRSDGDREWCGFVFKRG